MSIIIIQDEKGNLGSTDTAKLHAQSQTVDSKVRLYGEGVPPLNSKWTVFVQNKGSGARHLPAGSTLLYQV